MRFFSFFGSLLLLISCNSRVEFPEEVEAQLPQKIDFNLHVKPILSDRCFACHGPDAANQESGFRLDTEESAFAALEDNPNTFAIVPGDPHDSETLPPHHLRGPRADDAPAGF